MGFLRTEIADTALGSTIHRRDVKLEFVAIVTGIASRMSYGTVDFRFLIPRAYRCDAGW